MNKISWIVTAAAAAVALCLGFGAEWFGNQAYIRASFNAAFEDVGAGIEGTDVPEDMAAMEEYEKNPDEPAAEELPEAVPMSESTTDGIWDITITGVERTAQVSGSYSNAVAADGREFLILDVEMTNVSDAPQMPEIDSSEVVDDTGNRYGYHSDASLALDDDDVLYTDVNPGGSATLRIPFEMEAGTAVDIALLTGTWDDTGKVAAIRIEE